VKLVGLDAVLAIRARGVQPRLATRASFMPGGLAPWECRGIGKLPSTVECRRPRHGGLPVSPRKGSWSPPLPFHGQNGGGGRRPEPLPTLVPCPKPYGVGTWDSAGEARGRCSARPGTPARSSIRITVWACHRAPVGAELSPAISCTGSCRADNFASRGGSWRAGLNSHNSQPLHFFVELSSSSSNYSAGKRSLRGGHVRFSQGL
jgi:hypothetical protein